MNCHIITSDQKTAFYRKVQSMDFDVVFGDLIASILSDVKGEVLRQADMIEMVGDLVVMLGNPISRDMCLSL